MSRLRDIWYRLENAFLQANLWLLSVVPSFVVTAFVHVVARGAFWLSPERRRVAIHNLVAAGIAPDERAARPMARTAFDVFVMLVVETAISRRRMTKDNWHEHVRLDLKPEMRELLERPDQGLIVVSAHIGNWEVAARAASMIKPVTAIYRPFKNPYLDRSLQSSRSDENLHLVAKYEDDPMRFVRAITNGEILAIMIDQHARGGIPIEFFGRQALTTPSIAMLHLVTRAPLVVAYALRTGPLTYEVHASGPFEFRRSGDRERDVLTITTALTREVESIARAHPEQYMWGHRRWKYHEKRERGDS